MRFHKIILRIIEDKDERSLIKHIGLAFCIKGISMVVSLFSMPLYMKYFNNDEVLGLWYTILSTLSWIQVLDLGLGNGLRNRLTEALAVGDYTKSKNYVSSTYAVLAVLVVPVAIIGCILLRIVDLNAFLKIPVSVISRKTLIYAVTVLLCGVCINFILKTINVVIYAIQKSSINNVLALFSSVLPLLYVFLFGGSSVEKNLVHLTFVHVVAMNLPLLVATVMLFKGKLLRSVSPAFRAVSFQTAKDMLGFGVQFFLAQILFTFLISTNELMITRFFTAAKVVEYSIYYRLFTVIGSVFMLALTPLWSKITKDIAQKKYYKVRKTNHILYILSAFAAVTECVLVLCLQMAIDLWLGEEAIQVDYMVGFCFAFFGSVYILNIALTTVANGMGELKTQIICYGIASVLKIPVVQLLMKMINHWSVIVLYNGGALLVFCLIQMLWMERCIKQLMNNNQ